MLNLNHSGMILRGGDYSNINYNTSYYTRLDFGDTYITDRTTYARKIQIITYYDYLDISGVIKLGPDYAAKGMFCEENIVPINNDTPRYLSSLIDTSNQSNIIGYSLMEGKTWDNRYDESEWNIHTSSTVPEIKYYKSGSTVYYYLVCSLVDAQQGEGSNRNLVVFHVQVPRYQ